MADKKLGSFKIGDTKRAMVSRPQKASESAPEGFSLGYEKLEKLLEAEDPNVVIDGMNSSLATLQQVHDEARTPRDKSAALKAIRAYELTLDLLEFLFRTKEQLAQPSA